MKNDLCSHQRCTVRKVFFRNFTKFTGKHLCQSLFLNKVAGLRPPTLFKKRLWPVNFVKFLRTPFSQNTFSGCFFTSSFDTLLEKDMSFSVHDRKIQQLALAMFKVTKALASTAMSSLFLQCSNNRHKTSQSDFSVPQVNTVYFGQNSIRYLGPMELNPNCFDKY